MSQQDGDLPKFLFGKSGKHSVAIPKFSVDPSWPKPLPKNLILGQLAGVYFDSHDHVWIVSRPRTLTEDEVDASLNPPTSEYCIPAPPVIESDAAGNYLQGWGGPGPGYDWPQNEHGVFVDYKENVDRREHHEQYVPAASRRQSDLEIYP